MMRKTGFLLALALLSLTLQGGNAYYVCADGNDGADGRSPSSAWKTLQRVEAAAVCPGDSVLFHCGDVFRGHLRTVSGEEGRPVFYGSYGAGPKPVLEASYAAGSPDDWTPAGPGLWKCVKPSERELGNIIFDHGRQGCAHKEDRLALLAGQDLHFTWVGDEHAVYLVSGENPALRFSSIELAERQHIIRINGCHDVCIDHLWLRYGAAHGIQSNEVARISITRCDVCWIGGGTLYVDEKGNGVRYGNGIELWGQTEDVRVEGCRVWECWDAGLTNQTKMPGKSQRNIIWRSNEVWNCEYSYEYWNQGDGAVTENILFEGNVCRDAGKGWGHTQRWNPNAAHLMFYDNTAPTRSFVVRGNRFERTESCGLRLFNAWYRDITMEGNTWVVPANNLCRYHARPTQGLRYLYPDRLDQVHDDNEAEIQSQTVERPLVFGPGRRSLRRFKARFGF